MLVPMSWIKDYVDIDCDIIEFTDAMTMSGSKVEGYEELGKEITKVVVGKILKIEGHPDADKLIVTQVEVGKKEIIQIVTGADNVSEGDYVPIALVGSTLPGGINIKKGKLRGIPSNGMMCSIEELGFSKEDYPNAPEHGIFIFEKQYDLGKDVKEIFGLNDKVVEYEITSNRPDCQGILGIAREAAITFNKEFKYPSITVKEAGEDVNDFIKVEIEDEELCPRYTARVVKNIKIAPSPLWMKKRLIAAGINPINNIVDITNYVMMEFGQPMHAFDLSKIAQNKIVVKRASDNETFVTLDGEERKLDSSVLMICDGEKEIAVAGVMGGENSKVEDDVKTILFESANFKGSSVRITAKKLGLRTDASGKFEKGLDPNNCLDAINRACQLIEELEAGEVVSGIVDEYPTVLESKKVEYNKDSINALLGTDIEEDFMVSIFEKVGCIVDTENKIVSAPTHRPDLEREADLAEEVARFYGYDNIPVTIANGSATIGAKTYEQKIEDITKEVMEAYGLSEAMTYTFESPKVFDKLAIAKDDKLRETITIKNPLGEDFSIMRTISVNGILNSLSNNFNKRNDEACIYELGKIYLPYELPLENLPDERLQLTMGLYGKGVDFYSTKGIVEALLEQLGLLNEVSYEVSNEKNWLHPGRQAKILVKGKEIGVIGEVHPTVTDNYEIDTKAYLVVIDMPNLIKNSTLDRSFMPLPKYPAMTRDIAMLVKDEIMVAQIEEVIKKYGGRNLVEVTLFDVYKGEQIEKGYKSVAYSITFRSPDKTLKEKEVNKSMTKILSALEKELDAQLRK